MILLWALGIGLITGLGWAKWKARPYRPPKFKHTWLAFVAILPQLIALNLELLGLSAPDKTVAIALVTSQALLFLFVWLNRHVPGMTMLLIGLILNMAVMVTNRGFMPINPTTAESLIGSEKLSAYELGNRIGAKDILLAPDATNLEFLADRFLSPQGFPYQVAYSLGDVFIALGAFWILAYQNTNTKH
ncbi:MAG: DUF5317 domain-containing protein [Anaerolineae bacterium]|nr:DUF5317 domain-containing protein [Anaerolineae bacterium]MDK1118649.1 DUF5317 domain-containing protein [Anaerolineae bacterium]